MIIPLQILIPLIILAIVGFIATIGIVYCFLYYKKQETKKKKLEESKIMPKGGAFRLAPDCKHPNEYLCIKCGDCGRKFVL